MSEAHLSFRLPDAAWALEFSIEVQRTLGASAQLQRGSRESVGQIFTRCLASERVLVEVATVLKPTLAMRMKVRFDTAAALAERQAMFDRGLHCIGLWHTHPEPVPEPSSEDRSLALDYARAAMPQVSGVVFVIVGTLPMPAGVRVWVADENGLRLAPRLSGQER